MQNDTQNLVFILSLYPGCVDQTTAQPGYDPAPIPPVGRNPFALINTGNPRERHSLTPKQKQGVYLPLFSKPRKERATSPVQHAYSVS